MPAEDRYHVITGGPGSGKTSLIRALGHAGYAHSLEAGRAIIQDQTAIGGHALPQKDSIAFAELMLSWEMHSHRLARDQPGPIFFDRGVPDLVGYYSLLGQPVPAHVAQAAALFRYNRRVFIAPPWQDIFAHDAERKQSWEEAVRTYQAMVEAYASCGYELVSLPLVSVDERLRLIVDHLEPQNVQRSERTR